MPVAFELSASAPGGSTLANGAVTVTVPSGSDLAAVYCCHYNDMTVSGLTCSQGGASVTVLRNTLQMFTALVTGLSAGSATFTPTGTGSNDISAGVLVFSGVDQTTPLTGTAGGATFDGVIGNDTIAITTVDGGLSLAWWWRATADLPATVSSPAVSRLTTTAGSYARRAQIATRDATGTSSPIIVEAITWDSAYTSLALAPAGGGTELSQTLADTSPASDAVTAALAANRTLLTIPMG